MKKLLLILVFAGLCFSSAEAQKKDQEQPKKKVPYTYRTCNEIASRRTEIILPQVKGFNCYKADFHTHTSYSDGVVSPAGRVDEAWYDGLDIIAITDHLENRSGERKMFKVLAPYNKNGKPRAAIPAGSVRMPKDGVDPGIKADFNAIHAEAVYRNESKGYGLLLVKGCEMARPKIGHYNALFVKDVNTIYDPDPAVSMKKAREQGALIMHNHPGWRRKTCDMTEFEQQAYAEGLIDGVEIMNGVSFYPTSMQRCVDKKLYMLGCTDIHAQTDSYRFCGVFRTMTLIFAKENTSKAIRKALEKGMTLAYSAGNIAGEAKLLQDFFKASVDCKFLGRGKKGAATYALTNTTSIAYKLKYGKYLVELPAFHTITLSVGKSKDGVDKDLVFSVANMWEAGYKNPKIVYKAMAY